MLAGEDQSQANHWQPNSLAEGPLCKSKSLGDLRYRQQKVQVEGNRCPQSPGDEQKGMTIIGAENH
eukprot:517158-Pelagomonas_calceolata.AAC.1